jgi:DNA-binding NarL/FixJ family response regulator
MTRRILVVEGQPDDRRILRDMLALTDYQVLEVEDGEQALVSIAKQRPDLILMDLQFPIPDGLEATRRIKADPSLSSIPIIGRRCDMKTFFTALALAAVITVQALPQAAYAAHPRKRTIRPTPTFVQPQPPNDRHDGAGQKSGCMYQGYRCSDWDRIQDRW